MVTDESASIGAEQPVEAYLDDDRPTAETPAVRHDTPETDPVDEVDDTDQDTATPEPTRKKPAKKRGRASVPSWDEIMFGGSGSER
jgi:hypothetical protein